jgi:hypothetical protein
MADKPFRCVLGFHSYVREHPRDERLSGQSGEVCRLCGRHRGASGIPPAVLGS